MSLEYAIEYPCAMRDRYGEAQLRQLARKGALVARVVDASLQSPVAPSTASVKLTTQYAVELEELEKITAVCHAGCRACQTDVSAGEAVGCLGRIHYPIDAHFERFLANRVQLVLDTVQPEHWPRLLQILLATDSPFDGEATKSLRCVMTETGLRFYELRLPLPLMRVAQHLTTDHLFDLFAGFALPEMADPLSYQRHLPLVALADYAHFLGLVMFDDVPETVREQLLQSSSSFCEFERFTQAIQLAERLPARVLVD